MKQSSFRKNYVGRLLAIVGSWCFALVVLGTTASLGQDAGNLPEIVRQELAARFFMDEALELLSDYPTQASAQRRLETIGDQVQFMGSQARGDEVTDGYVSRSPEGFVSITLFFDRDSGSMMTVHVVISPGMWSRALQMIEGAFDSDPSSDVPRGDRAYLLGTEERGDQDFRVFLSEQESELGTIYAINYMLSR
jgi:hypothetical protein